MQATMSSTIAKRAGIRQSVWVDAGLVFVGSVLIALFAQVRIPLPFTPVPITGQTFAVLFVGAALGRRRGAASVLLYLAEGAVGLPVFAGGAGLARLFGPTGGYLVGFLPAAYLAGWSAEQGLDRRWFAALPHFLLAQLSIYLTGVLWLATYVGWQQVLLAGLVPFLVLDAAKALLAAAALPSAWRLLDALERS
jgi:biotin transport system substrate-specific component